MDDDFTFHAGIAGSSQPWGDKRIRRHQMDLHGDRLRLPHYLRAHKIDSNKPNCYAGNLPRTTSCRYC